MCASTLPWTRCRGVRPPRRLHAARLPRQRTCVAASIVVPRAMPLLYFAASWRNHGESVLQWNLSFTEPPVISMRREEVGCPVEGRKTCRTAGRLVLVGGATADFDECLWCTQAAPAAWVADSGLSTGAHPPPPPPSSFPRPRNCIAAWVRACAHRDYRPSSQVPFPVHSHLSRISWMQNRGFAGAGVERYRPVQRIITGGSVRRQSRLPHHGRGASVHRSERCLCGG